MDRVKAYSTVSLPLSIQTSGELRGFVLLEPTSVLAAKLWENNEKH